MDKKVGLFAFLSFLALMTLLQTAKAATITSATLDKSTYLAGQTGYISVTVYNDKSQKIRVTDLSATINYYYADGTVYVQKFFTSATLPDEIQEGQTETYQIPISLPTNIAPGYTNPTVEARTELWQSNIEHWLPSDRATYELRLYIESPANANLTNTISVLTLTTMIFAAVSAFLMFLVFTGRQRPVSQP